MTTIFSFRLIKNENYEYLDNAIQMMSYFTYYSEGMKYMRGWRGEERKGEERRGGGQK